MILFKFEDKQEKISDLNTKTCSPAADGNTSRLEMRRVRLGAVSQALGSTYECA